jgi:hypothetical protein
VTVLGKRQLCVVKCKRKDLLSTSIVGKIFNRSSKICVFLNLLQRAYVLLNPLIKGELGMFH